MKAKNIDSYIAGFPKEIQDPLKEIRGRKSGLLH